VVVVKTSATALTLHCYTSKKGFTEQLTFSVQHDCCQREHQFI